MAKATVAANRRGCIGAEPTFWTKSGKLGMMQRTVRRSKNSGKADKEVVDKNPPRLETEDTGRGKNPRSVKPLKPKGKGAKNRATEVAFGRQKRAGQHSPTGAKT